MKKFRNIAIVIATALAITSCSDAIDIVQDGEINPDLTLTTVANLENYLNGAVYGSLDNSSAIKYTSLFTDELRIGPSNSGQDLANFRWIITPQNGYAESIWGGNYTTINRVNILVDRAQKITPASGEVARYNSTIAEARALRALSYLNLMTYFSTDMKNDNALGVMLPLQPMPITEVLPRVSNGQVWAAVEADLNFAYANIGNTARPLPLFLSKAGVSAIRARMYLYRGNYTLAAQNAQQAITDSGLSMTAATPIPTGTVGSAAWNTAFYPQTGGPSPYRRIWTDSEVDATNGYPSGNGENIFKLSRPLTTTSGIGQLYTTNISSISGSPLWTTGINLFNLYTYTASDIRRYAFVDPTSDLTNRYYVIDKYPGRPNYQLRNDIKLFRLTEMYLILAEAAANGPAPDLATAATIVRNIRQVRKYNGTATLPVYASVGDALRDILRERRIELSFEGHRFIDLKRLGTAAGVSVDRNAADDRIIASTPLTIPLTDYRWTMPIPVAEINGNPTIIQNPGY